MTFGIPDPGRASKAVQIVVAERMTAAALSFRQVCMLTGDIADPSESSDAVLCLTDDAVSGRPAPAVSRAAGAGHTNSP